MISGDTSRTPNEGVTSGSQSIEYGGAALRSAAAEVRSILLAAAFAILLGASVLLHELGHCVVALQLGIPVRRLRLFLLGGLAEITRTPRRPAHEGVIAAAGPAVSAVLAAFLRCASGALGLRASATRSGRALMSTLGPARSMPLCMAGPLPDALARAPSLAARPLRMAACGGLPESRNSCYRISSARRRFRLWPKS